MDAALLAAAGATVAAAGLAGIELREQRRAGQYLKRELRFGRDVTPEAVLAVIDRIAGNHRFACVALETWANHGGIEHFVATDQATLDAIQTSLRAHLPSVDLEVAERSAQV